MSGRPAFGFIGRRPIRVGLAIAVIAGVAAVPISVVLSQGPAGAQSDTTYVPGTPVVDTITDGTSQAPWNSSQGDTAAQPYASQSPGTLLPTYTPGGVNTGSGTTAEPNLAVYPANNSGAANGNSPYPSGVVGTPGPLDGYCGSGPVANEVDGSPVRQPVDTVLPFAPAYFPHVVRNADGSLTGYFDYRPKDEDEALVAAKSTDNGKDWTYEGEALEQNPGYCASADTNDDGQGHANVISADGSSYLYTLPRPAGDNNGVGMLMHTLTPTASNPLAGLPTSEKTGVDPDAFATAGASVPFTGGSGATIDVNQTGAANSPEQLVSGPFLDVNLSTTITPASIITCTGVGTTTLTGCTSATSGGVTINSGDMIEQVVGTVSTAETIDAGPNNTLGTGGTANLPITFANNITATLLNTNAPNRIYVNGVAVYCTQANASPTTKLEDCTTGEANPSMSAPVGSVVTTDPVVPATATQTTGLIAPDGIVGVLPSYPGAPSASSGAVIYMYTEKLLNYYIAGVTSASGTYSSTTGKTITFYTNANTSSSMPTTVSASSPVTVSVADDTKNIVIQATCTGMTAPVGSMESNSSPQTATLTGCLVPSADSGDTYTTKDYIGAPNAAVELPATLAETGEGSTSQDKLYKNNEDLTVLRVAYTYDGINFQTTNLADGGIISGTNSGGSNYNDISNPSTTTDPPSGLNEYATAGDTDATEMRWVGSAGSIITNPDGSYGLFLSGAWPADGDSDAFNQIFYSSSTNGENWTEPVSVVSTDYTFAASRAQDVALQGGTDAPLGISAYYSGRAYGPSVVQNPNGSLTMVFAGYRLPKPITNAGTSLGTNLSAQYTIGATDPALYRNIMTVTLSSSTTPGVGTTTAVSSSPPSPVVGQTVTLSATVSVTSPGTGTPTGTVSFSDNNGPICTGNLSESSPDIASCTTTYSGVTSDNVAGEYSGDNNYAGSSGNTTVDVGQDSTTTVVTGPGSASVTGQPVTYTATVTDNNPGAGSPTGAVTFTDNGSAVPTSPSCSGSLSGGGSSPTATCTISEPSSGSHAIVATYAGDTNDGGSTSNTFEQTVNVDPTTTSFVFSPTTPTAGHPVTFTATVSANGPGSGDPTGQVTFTGNSGTLCAATLSDSSPDNASCSATYPAATNDTVYASYATDGNYGSSSSASQPVDVTSGGTPPPADPAGGAAPVAPHFYNGNVEGVRGTASDTTYSMMQKMDDLFTGAGLYGCTLNSAAGQTLYNSSDPASSSSNENDYCQSGQNQATTDVNDNWDRTEITSGTDSGNAATGESQLCGATPSPLSVDFAESSEPPTGVCGTEVGAGYAKDGVPIIDYTVNPAALGTSTSAAYGSINGGVIGPVASGWLPGNPANGPYTGTALTNISNSGGADSTAYRLWCASDSTEITDWGQLTNLGPDLQVQGVSTTSGSSTITVSGNFPSTVAFGDAISGPGIQSGTTLSSVSGGSAVLSANATANGTSNVVITTSGTLAVGQGSPIGIPVRITGLDAGSGTEATFASFAESGVAGGGCAANMDGNAASDPNAATANGSNSAPHIATDNNSETVSEFAAVDFPSPDYVDQSIEVATTLYVSSNGAFNTDPYDAAATIDGTLYSGNKVAENGLDTSTANLLQNAYPTARTLFNIYRTDTIRASTAGYLNWICDADTNFNKGLDNSSGKNFDAEVTTLITTTYGFPRLTDVSAAPATAVPADGIAAPNTACAASLAVSTTSGADTITLTGGGNFPPDIVNGGGLVGGGSVGVGNADFPAGTTVTSGAGTSTLTLSNNASATGTAVATTFSGVPVVTSVANTQS